MQDLYKQYLFNKKILVSEGTGENNPFECLVSLAELFGIRITEGKMLVREYDFEKILKFMNQG